MEPASGYEYFEHTADVGIHAWGPTLADAFGQAALGMIGNMVDLSQARPVGEAEMVIEEENIERLFFKFLEDLLDLFYTRSWVMCGIDVRIEGTTRLTATLKGEALDAERHGHVHEIKAITWHDLEVNATPPSVRVIVDI